MERLIPKPEFVPPPLEESSKKVAFLISNGYIQESESAVVLKKLQSNPEHYIDPFTFEGILQNDPDRL